jgi:hypothetical protein
MAGGNSGTQQAERETPREGDSPLPRPSFTPSRRLLSDHQRVVRSKNLTIGVLLAGLLLVWMTVSSATATQKVLVIDPVGGVTQGPLEPLATSKGFFSITSINAVQACLQRSSVGFDLNELLPLYFTARARRLLDEDLNRRWEDMRKRRLTLKPVIDSITPPQDAAGARVVRVTGRLQTTGVVNGRVFYDEPPFQTIFLFRENADLSNRASMPWVVDEFELSIGADEIEKQKARSVPKA